MFAFLTASALSQELQVGSHFLSGTDDTAGTFPSDAAQYVYFTPDPSSETYSPIFEIHKPGESTTLRFGKSAVVHYSLFKIPANYKYFVGFNSVTQNKWTIQKESVVILLFSKPISCKVEGTNLLTSSTPTDFTKDGQEGDSHFLGSTMIAIKTSGQPATITFSNTITSGVVSFNTSSYSPEQGTGSYTDPDQINATHLGVYTSSKTSLTVTPKNGYKIKCIQCTNGSNNQLNADNSKPIVFVVFTGADNFDYIATNNGSRYISTSGTERSDKTTYIVSDLPFTLTYSKTSDTTLSLGDSFDMTSSFDSISKERATIYDQFIGLKLGKDGIFFIEKINGEASNITATTQKTNGIEKTENDCLIINEQGIRSLSIESTTVLATTSSLVTYYSKDSSFQSTTNGPATITVAGKYDLITVSTATTIVSGNPTNTIFSTSDTKKILFLSGSQGTSFRSLREQPTKFIEYYSSSNAVIQILPLEAINDQKFSNITEAKAVYIEENDINQKAIGFLNSGGYDGAKDIKPTSTKPLTNPKIFKSSSQLTTADTTPITLIPTPYQKNILVLLDSTQFDGKLSNLNAITEITTITPKKADLIYGVVLLDNNIDRVSAIIDPPEYTRKVVAQGNCAIIAISSNTFTYSATPQNSLYTTPVAPHFYIFTTRATSDIYIDFITGSKEKKKIVNLDDIKPALVNYDPVWNPSTNFNGTIIKEGRYDFQLTSNVQTVTASTSTIVFFVPKSMDQKVVINVINPVDGSKDVKKFDLFKNKILGYYFDTALNIELSGESNLEVYVYKLSFTPSSFEGIVFKRGGSEITSKFGFVGFSNYSLCVMTSPPKSGLYAYDGATLYSSPILTGNPFYFTNDASTTVKYQLKRADRNDPEEAEFTITASDNSNEGISSASLHKHDGELQKYQPNSGLSKGQVAGIVVAIILFIIIDVAIVVLVCYCRKHEPKPQFNFEEEEDALQGDIGADPDGGDVQAGPDVPEDAPAEEAPAN